MLTVQAVCAESFDRLRDPCTPATPSGLPGMILRSFLMSSALVLRRFRLPRFDVERTQHYSPLVLVWPGLTLGFWNLGRTSWEFRWTMRSFEHCWKRPKTQDLGRKQSRHPRNGHSRLNRTSYIIIFSHFLSAPTPPFETGEDLPSNPSQLRVNPRQELTLMTVWAWICFTTSCATKTQTELEKCAIANIDSTVRFEMAPRSMLSTFENCKIILQYTAFVSFRREAQFACIDYRWFCSMQRYVAVAR